MYHVRTSQDFDISLPIQMNYSALNHPYFFAGYALTVAFAVVAPAQSPSRHSALVCCHLCST